MVRPLADRVCLVTGASRRGAIGAAIVRRLGQQGAAVLLHSWVPHDAVQPWGADEGGGAALLEELRSAGGNVDHVSLDRDDRAAAPTRTSSSDDGEQIPAHDR